MESTLRIAGETAKALPKKMNFTHANLTAAKCPAGKERAWLYDNKMPGLTFMLTAAGAKSFYFLKKVNGRFVRFRLGGFPELHLDNARKAAAEHAGQVARGLDPQEQRRAERKQMTFGALFDHYLETHAKLHKRDWKDDQAQYDRHLHGWKGRRINAIQRADVAALHAKIGRDNGKYSANRVLALLSKMFNIARDFGIEVNPAKGVKKFAEEKRERFADKEELARLLPAIDAAPAPWNHFFKLCLLTGQRRSNIESMRWDELNLAESVWTIPGEKAKGHKLVRVPLHPAALVILKERLEARKGENEWVFPSYGKLGHISEPKMAWKAILETAKITERLTIHDLRRTYGSWQTALGASLQVVGKSLGHANLASTAIYARLNLDPVRASVNAAGDAMLATVKASEVANAK